MSGAVADERFVWWLWQTRRYDVGRTRAAGFDIVFPGWFSTDAGPDFRDALVADSQGVLRQGDVEVHVRSSGWFEHGHHLDDAYDPVILHVVLWAGSTRPTTTHSGAGVPILELESYLCDSIEELLGSYPGDPPSVVPCLGNRVLGATALDVIGVHGERRLQAKVARMISDVEAVGAEEALHRALAESLGYSRNRQAFRRLAEAIPFDLLRSLSLFEAEQLLLAGAGLAEPAALRPYLDEPVLGRGDLSTFRVRPGNAPAARLRGLARTIHRHRSTLAGAMISCPIQHLWKLFVIEAETTLVGRGRADDIVVNVALPYLVGYHGQDGPTALRMLAAPPDNRWTQSLRDLLSTRGVRLRPYRALHHQGLLDLALEYCRFGKCDTCPLHR